MRIAIKSNQRAARTNLISPIGKVEIAADAPVGINSGRFPHFQDYIYPNIFTFIHIKV